MKMTYRGDKNTPLTYEEVDQNFKNFYDSYLYITSYKTIEIKNDDATEIELDIDANKNFHIKTHVDTNITLKHTEATFDNVRDLVITFNRTANAKISIEGVPYITDADSKLIHVFVFISKSSHEIFIK